MKLLSLLLLFLVPAAFAQPYAGPFTLLEQPAVNLSLGYVGGAARGDTVDVLFIAEHNLHYLAADLDDGTVTVPLTLLRTGDRERTLTVPAIQRIDDGWAAMVHEYDGLGNDTWYYHGRNGLHSEMLLAASRNYCDPDAYITWGSVKLCFAIAPQRNGLSALGWVDSWCNRVGGGWVEGGYGNQYYPISGLAPPDTSYSTNVLNAEELRLQVIRTDSVVALASGFGWLSQWALPTLAYHPEFIERNCPGRLTEWLLTRGGFSLVLMRDPARLVELTATACIERIPLEREPIAWASHPDFGLAWIAQAGGSLVLYRADTTGTWWPADGILAAIEPGYQLAGCALAITEEGRLALLWTENSVSDPAYPRLRLASVGWSTPLGTSGPLAMLHPSAFALQAHPNPFNAVTTLEVALPEAGRVKLAVYDLLGREVAVLHAGVLPAGAHTLRWNADAQPAGVYFARLETAQRTTTQKLLLLK